MSNNLRAGDLIQVWDTVGKLPGDRLPDHGSLGYIVSPSRPGDLYQTGDGQSVKLEFVDCKDEGGNVEHQIYKCVFFTDHGVHKYQHVNKAWLRKIDKPSDILEVEK